jgi:hypothetical protein
MGQYGNQPDFGTRAKNINPYGDPSNGTPNIAPAALYIGVGGTLICRVVGGNANILNPNEEQTGWTTFINIPNGTFFPVIVSGVYGGDGNSNTTCTDIVALY